MEAGLSGLSEMLEEATTALEDLPDSSNTSTVTQGPDQPLSNTFNCVLFKFITNGLSIVVLCLIGVVGNTLSVITFKQRAHENATSLMLMSLAVVDIGVLLTYTVMLITPSFCDFFRTCPIYTNYVHLALSAYFWPLASALHLASTWHVTLVTFHRYMGVCHPHKFGQWTGIRRTRYQILAIDVISVLYNIPRFVDDKVEMKPGGGGYLLLKTSLGASKTYGYVYDVGLYYLFIYAIPFACLIYMTVRLVKALKASRVKRKAMTQAKKDEDDLTLALVVVVLVYMVCQVMNPIRRGMFLILPRSKRYCGSAYSFVSYMTSLGILINSAANFFIYCLFGKRFRRHLTESLPCIKRNRIGAMESQSSGTKSKTGPTPATDSTV